MRKLLFTLLLLPLFAYGQDLYFTPLENYGITQSFPFGYSVKNDDYKEYAKNKKNKSKIKDNPSISNVFFYEDKSKNNIYGIGIQFKSKKIGEEFISSLNLGSPEIRTSVSDLGYSTNSTKYNNLYYDRFVIRYNSMDHIEVYCYDYAPFIDNYDEFEKTGTSFLDINYKLDCDNGMANSNFAYFINGDIPTISFLFSYEGIAWMFANEVTFLLDNGETIKAELKHTRNLDGIVCKETCIANIDIAQARTLSQQKMAKYKISGEKFNIAYILNPALVSSLDYAIECLDNKKGFK